MNAALKKRKAAGALEDSLEELKSNVDIIYALSAFLNYRFARFEYEKCRAVLLSLKKLFQWLFQLKEELICQKSQSDNVQAQRRFKSLLNVFAKERLNLEKLSLSMQIIEAQMEKDPARAGRILKESLKKAAALEERSWIPYILLYTAFHHYSNGERREADMYMDLARDGAQKFELKTLFKYCRDVMERFQAADNNREADIVLNIQERSLMVKGKGLVELKSRSLLWDLFYLLMERRGEAVSKQELSKKLWNKEAGSASCDNKLYVTIKRLRQILEPENQRYILRAEGGGWFFNPKVKVSDFA